MKKTLPHWEVEENLISVDFGKRTLEQQAVEIFSTAFPSVFGFGDGIDGMYVAPEKDPA